MVTWASRGTLWELFWLLAGALGVSGGSSGDPWASLGGPWELPGRIGGGPGCPGRVPGGPWGVPGGVLEGLWGMLGLSGALLGGLGDPQSDPRSVFKCSRQDEKSLNNLWFLYNFQQLGRPWEPLEVPGGPWVVLRGALERVRRPKQRPGTARQSHRQPRGGAQGSAGGSEGSAGAGP